MVEEVKYEAVIMLHGSSSTVSDTHTQDAAKSESGILSGEGEEKIEWQVTPFT